MNTLRLVLALVLLSSGISASAPTSIASAPPPAASSPAPAASPPPPPAPISQPAASAPLPAPAPAPPAEGIHYLYLIRHGMYDRDEKVTDDRVGNGLNALGHEQARLLGARLLALPIKIHEIDASDFKRARETAEEIGAVIKLKPVLDPLLHECTPSMEPDRDLASKHDMEACNAQLAELWAKYAKPTPDRNVYDALVAHGNVIRWLTMRALQADPRRWIALDIANASLTVIAVKANGSATLVQYSDASHIPYALQTWSGAGPGWAPAKLAR